MYEAMYTSGLFSAGTGILAFQVASDDMSLWRLPAWGVAVPLAGWLYWTVYKRATSAAPSDL